MTNLNYYFVSKKLLVKKERKKLLVIPCITGSFRYLFYFSLPNFYLSPSWLPYGVCSIGFRDGI